MLHLVERQDAKGSPCAVAVGNTELIGTRDKLQDDVRFLVLRPLKRYLEMLQHNLAQAVGISRGSVYYLLKALVEKGLIKLGHLTASKDKWRYAYVLTSKGISERAALSQRFLVRKMTEYKTLRAEMEKVRGDLSSAKLKPTRQKE